MAVGGVQMRFQFGLFGGQLVEIGVGIGVGGIDFVEPGLGALIGATASSILPRGLAGIELRLLRQVADVDAGLRAGFAVEYRCRCRP